MTMLPTGEECVCFTRAAQEDEKHMDDFNVDGLKVVADMKLGKTIGKQTLLFYIDCAQCMHLVAKEMPAIVAQHLDCSNFPLLLWQFLLMTSFIPIFHLSTLTHCLYLSTTLLF